MILGWTSCFLYEGILGVCCLDLVHFGAASICGCFGFRSCLFYSSLVLPIMNHLLCNPVVMSRVSSDLDSLYGSPGSNSIRKIILACCSKLWSTWCEVCHLKTTMLHTAVVFHWTSTTFKQPKLCSLCCPRWWPPLIRCSKHKKTNAKNYICLFDCIQCIILQMYPSRWNEGLITATVLLSLTCTMITAHFVFFFFWLVSHNGSNCLVFF